MARLGRARVRVDSDGVKKISSGQTLFSKKVFPVIWFGVLGFIALGTLFNGAPKQDPMLVVIPLVMAAVGFFIMRGMVWDLMDEVYDCGNFLLVRNRDEEDSIPLANIMNVSASTNQRPPRITLRLVKPCKFGTEITFSPLTPFTLNLFAKNNVAEDLILRVHEERSKHAV